LLSLSPSPVPAHARALSPSKKKRRMEGWMEEWMDGWTHLMRILEGGDKFVKTIFLHLLKSRTKYLLKNIRNHHQNNMVLELEPFIFTSSLE